MTDPENSDTCPMPLTDRVDDLLEQWEAACEQGTEVSVDELCADCPELRNELAARISALQTNNPRMRDDGDSPLPDSQTALSVHSEISRLSFHARGGLGVVYRAQETDLNREVAVKFIHRRLLKNAESRQRFLLEAEVTGRLEHPGVVPLYGMGEAENGRLFYYMRYIDGETLDDALNRFHDERAGSSQLRAHRVEFRRLLAAFISVCRTVAYAHTRGIVHRDIKPANVMLGRYGETIVVDWGLAAPVTRDERFRLSGEATLMPASGSKPGTSSGHGVGTPAYMSPEQMSGLAPTPASDVYSLGATLYKVLTGRAAFTGDDAVLLKKQVIEGTFPRPQSCCAGVPGELQAICLKAMSVQSSQRYHTALDLANDVENFLADAPVSAYPEPLIHRLMRWTRRHKAAAQSIVAASFAILLISFGAAIVLRRLAHQEHLARTAAVEHSRAAEAARIQNLKLSAGFLSKAIGYEIDRRWRLLETEVRSAALRNMLTEINAHPDQPELRAPLQSWLADRSAFNGAAIRNSGWAVFDAQGTQVARSPRARSIGRNYRHRDYFHGFGRDFPPGSPDAATVGVFEYLLQRVSDQEAVYMCAVYESTNTQTLVVSFSTPIWDKPEEEEHRMPIGVFSLPLEISDFGLPVNAMLFQLDDDPFEEQPGLIIAHSRLGERSRSDLPPRVDAAVVRLGQDLRRQRLSERRVESLADERVNGFLPEFRDPLTEQVSSAAIDPIIVPGRPEEIGNIGWCVVVKEVSTGVTSEQGL